MQFTLNTSKYLDIGFFGPKCKYKVQMQNRITIVHPKKPISKYLILKV